MTVGTGVASLTAQRNIGSPGKGSRGQSRSHNDPAAGKAPPRPRPRSARAAAAVAQAAAARWRSAPVRSSASSGCASARATASRFASSVSRNSLQSAGVPNRWRTAASRRLGCCFSLGNVSRKASTSRSDRNAARDRRIKRRAFARFRLGEAQVTGRDLGGIHASTNGSCGCGPKAHPLDHCTDAQRALAQDGRFGLSSVRRLAGAPMNRDRTHFLLLNIGHFLDHLFTLIFATVAALALIARMGAELRRPAQIRDARLLRVRRVRLSGRLARRQMEPRGHDGRVLRRHRRSPRSRPDLRRRRCRSASGCS